MTTIDSIEEFFSNKNIAVVGVSGKSKGFGYAVYNKLKESGYNVFPVNNNAKQVDGNECYSSVTELTGKVESVVLVIPPKSTKDVVMEAAESGIHNVWFQPGSESKETVDFAKENKLNVIEKECVMMFTEPVHGFHKFHRGLTKLTGKYPK